MPRFTKLSKKLSILIVTLSVTLGILSFSIDNDDFEIIKNMDIYYSLFKEINLTYVEKTDPGELIKTSIDEMLKSLDPYTVYYPESDMEEFMFLTTGQYGGIGALILQKGTKFIIVEPYKGYPAERAGLRAGDEILEIQGKSLKTANLDDISTYLKGAPQSAIRLKVKRYGISQPFDVVLAREVIKMKTVPYYGVISDKIGYISLTGFTDDASKEVFNAYKELTKDGPLNGLVFDLRDNPGGLVIEAVNIVNFFVNKGQLIVSTRGKNSESNRQIFAMNIPIAPDLPLVVLVNSGSASASEIVAGALQDLDRAVVMGSRTFGKGLVQVTKPLSYNSRLKVTTAKYYIPSGRCIQALDYAHRNPDGSVKKIADSLVTTFKTKSGRLVRDGAGIEPDYSINNAGENNLVQQLVYQNIIFDFATKYAFENTSIAKADEFKISDVEFGSFIQYARDNNFMYKTRTEILFDSLIQVASVEKIDVKDNTGLKEIQTSLNENKAKELKEAEPYIREMLQQEIVSRFYFQKGRIEYLLKHDVLIKDAIEILNDKTRYKTFLTAK